MARRNAIGFPASSRRLGTIAVGFVRGRRCNFYVSFRCSRTARPTRGASFLPGPALAARVLTNQGHGKGRLSSVPFASGWTQYRDLPAPQGKTFHQLWKERRS